MRTGPLHAPASRNKASPGRQPLPVHIGHILPLLGFGWSQEMPGSSSALGHGSPWMALGQSLLRLLQKKREIQPSKSQEQLLSYHPWPTESFKALRPSHVEGGGRGGLIAPSTGRMRSDKEDFPKTWPAWSRKCSEGKLLFEMLKIAPSATPSTKTPPYL